VELPPPLPTNNQDYTISNNIKGKSVLWMFFPFFIFTNMKYLIAGLGNFEPKYWGTRHNIGFRIVNAVAEDAGMPFTEARYGAISKVRVKNKEMILLKPNTFMNLSGLAVRYWLQKENIPVENLLVAVDDLALPFGTLRLKPKGSHAGHNGLRNIEEILGTQEYCRLRFGIGNDFPRGGQVGFVLSMFDPEEMEVMPEKMQRAVEIIKSFCLSGVQVTMNQFNNR
jgi:PTH1 family peptidyl-tRNA hydrolase